MSIFSKWFSNKKQQDGTISVTPQKPQCSAADYYEQGQKMLDSGKLMTAMEFFQAAIEADRYFEKAYFLLAEVYQKQGKIDKAKAALYALLVIDPNNDAALKRLEQLNQTAQNATSSPITSVGQSQMKFLASASNLVANNTTAVKPQFKIKRNYRVFDGKNSDRFDFFIIFDDGNRLYFKVLSAKDLSVAVVAPSKAEGYYGKKCWNGYICPSGAIEIPSMVEYNGKNYVVKTIDNYAFALCSEIKSIVIPDAVTAILNSAFYYCLSLKNIRLSSALETIEANSFIACPFGNIDIPDGVKCIGSGAFSMCGNLTSFRLPKSLELVESKLFTGCTKLNNIFVPESVKEIRNNAFGDEKFTNPGSNTIILNMESIIPPKIGESIVNNDFVRRFNDKIKVSVFVPKGALDAYMIAQYWQLFDIKEM